MLECRIKETQLHALCYAVCAFLFAIGHTKIQNLSFLTGIMVTYGKLIPIGISALVLLRGFRFNIRSLLIITAFIILLLMDFLWHDLSYTIFFMVYFMISCSRTDPIYIYKYFAISVYTAIVLTLFLTNLGLLINDNSWYGRYDLGFTYCTFGPNLFFAASIALLSWKKERVNWKWWCFILLMNQYFFWKTDTDAVYLCVIMMFFCWIAIKNTKVRHLIENSGFCKVLFSHSAAIFAVLTIMFQLYYNSHLTSIAMIWLNDRLSTRLYMGYRVFARYSEGLPLLRDLLLGMRTELATYLDSSYLSVLTQFGMLTLIGFCAFMDLIGKIAYEKKDYMVAVCVFIFMIHCVTDPQLSSFRCNPLMITALFYHKQKYNNKLKSISAYY